MARPGAVAGVVAAVALVGLAAEAGHQVQQKQQLAARVRALTGGGDPDRGKAAIARRPCGGCHQIPGIGGAEGHVGPSLSGFAGRDYIGGRAQNTPDNLIQWIEDPHAIDPQNVMPPTGVGEREARDMAAYLYTLE